MRPKDAIPLPEIQDGSDSSPNAAAVLQAHLLGDAVTGYESTRDSRPLNYKCLGILIGSFVGVVIAVGVIHEFQMQRMSNLFLKRAHDAAGVGDLKQEVINLKRYLKFVPDDRKSEIELVLTLSKLAKTSRQHFEVFLKLEHLLRDDDERYDLQLKLVETAMKLGRFDDAIVHLKQLQHNSPDDGELQALLAQCYEANGDFEDAAAAYKIAIDADPRNADNFKRLALLLKNNLDQLDAADKVMDRLVATNPKSFRAYLSRARYKYGNGLLKNATVDARRAYQMAPNDSRVLEFLAEIMLSQAGSAEPSNEFSVQDVSARIEEALRKNPDDVRLNRAMAQLEMIDGQLESAQTRLQRASKDHPNDVELRWLLSQVLIATGKLDELRPQLDYFRKLKEYPGLLSYIEAHLLMEKGDWLNAARKLEFVRTATMGRLDLQKDVNLYLGRCCQKIGHSERRVACFRRVVNLDGLSAKGRLGLAAALADGGRVDDALIHYRQLMNVAGVPILVARLLIIRNLRLTEEERDWSEVERILNLASRDRSKLIDVMLLRAEMLNAQGEKNRAREMLQRAIQRQPGQARLWVALVNLQYRSGQLADAMEVLEKANRQVGARIEFYLARIQLFARQGGEAGLQTLLGLAEKRHRFSKESQQIVTRALASAFEQIGENAKADELWQEAAKLAPNDLFAWRRLAELALRAGDNNAAIKRIAEIRRIEGETGTYWRLGEANRYIMLAYQGKAGHLTEARGLLDEISDELSTSPLIPLSRAKIAELEKDEDALVEHYLAAIDRGALNARIAYRVIELLLQRSRYDDAHRILQQLRQRQTAPLSPNFSRLAVNIAVQTKDFEQALALVRQAVSSDSTNYRDHLFLGQVLWAAEEIDEAEQSLRTAVKLDQSRPESWTALVYFLVQNEKQAQAQEVISMAAKHLPADRAALALARCHEMVGEMELARKYFLQALEKDPQNANVVWSVAQYDLRRSNLEEAEPLLRQLIDSKMKIARLIQMSARRALASLLVSKGGYDHFQQGIKLIDQNINEFGGAAEDQRVKARLLATRPLRKHQREAISLLLALEERIRLSGSDQFQLVNLLLAVGDWTRARESLQGLLAAEGDNPDYVAFAIRTLLDHGESHSATEQWVETLERLQPNAFRTIELKASLLASQLKTDEAIAVLRAGIDREGIEKDERPLRLRRSAVVIENVSRQMDVAGRTLEAEKLSQHAEAFYREFVKQKPEDVLVLARFLGRQWRLKEALALCEKAWGSLPDEKIAIECIAILRSRRATSDQFQMVGKWFEAAMRRNPDSLELKFQMANLEQLRGHFSAAERLYRKAIEKSPKAILAYNELAMLLALHKKNQSEALKAVNQAITLAGPLAVLLDTRAMVYLSMSQNQEAIRDLKRAIAESPTPAKYFHLAQAQLAVENRSAARLAYQKGVAAGLHADALHPLERPAYDRLQTQLQDF